MKRILLLLSLLIPFLLFSIGVKGQAPVCSNPGGGAFDVAQSEGCAPLTVTVTNKKTGADLIEYVYDLAKGQVDIPDKILRTSSTSYSYTKAGTYTILQWGTAVVGFTACKDIVVRETAAPNAQLTTCKSGRVRLTLVDDAIYQAYDAIEIDWGNGQKIKVNKGGLLIHDKVLGINPSVKIKGIYNQGFCASEVKSNTLTGLINPPSLASIKIKRIEMSADGKALIVFNGMQDIESELFISDGGQFATTNKKSHVSGEVSILVEGLDPSKVYNFKLISKDICDNPTDSPIANSVALKKDIVVSDESNSMTWSSYSSSGGPLVYQILRDNGTSKDELVFNSADALFFSDDKVKCGETYTYQLLVADGDVRSYSAPLELVPTTSDPEKITTASVAVDDVNLVSTLVSFSGNGITSTYNLIVERANAGSSDFLQVSPPGNQSINYEDTDVNTSSTSYCYRFIYENSCKKISPPSDPICSILLTNNIQDISWSDKSPFSSGIESYDLVKMDAAGAVQDEMPKQLETRHAIDLNADGNSSFKVKAKSGNMISYSNVVSISGDVIMLIPDIFTPNGDTHNDKFEVKSIFTNSFRIRIYSRWGEMVFQSENAVDGWDGNISGKPAADGHYVYKIEATTLKGEPISKTGGLMLVR
ncbi:gliding motility-associated C-terminal domain-containing protein [Dyadobacter sp. CY312]|uniref:T9SS type B sorting domain-containing protein n=1 Tax=Dyadobacter sp. CY312 TaxID=2907303 RepID=UPI001F456AB7|nr:gliding motility-associated C-terminal domain-containing protein [Dyadobacter sp. CY312]MCE7042179.1 gliding motility-associated C-terminal domain-containing protein [Dyadobacter sp. CY312]